MADISTSQTVSRWKDFANLWTDELVRYMYASKVLGYDSMLAFNYSKAPLKTSEASAEDKPYFSNGSVTIYPHTPEELAKSKSWHSSLLKKGILDTPDALALSSLLKTTSENCTDNNFEDRQRSIAEQIKGSDYITLRALAFNLTSTGHPVVGLLLGPIVEKQGHPRDAAALVHLGIGILEEKNPEELQRTIDSLKDYAPIRKLY